MTVLVIIKGCHASYLNYNRVMVNFIHCFAEINVHKSQTSHYTHYCINHNLVTLKEIITINDCNILTSEHSSLTTSFFTHFLRIFL